MEGSGRQKEFRTVIGSVGKWKNLVGISRFPLLLSAGVVSAMLAARENRGWPGWKEVVLVVGAVFFARLCFLAYGQGVRCRSREFQGEGCSLLSLGLPLVLGVLGVELCGWFANALSFYVLPFILAAICFYHHVRQFSDFSSFYLGGVVGLVPIGAWIFVTGQVSWEPFILGGISVAWVSGLDTLYCIRSYKIAGLVGGAVQHSLVTRWGVKNALSYAFIAHLVAVMLMAVFGLAVQFKIAYMVGLGFITACVLMEHWLAKIRKTFWIRNSFRNLNAVACVVYVVVSACEIVFPLFNFYR